jgi:hypothetical protein
MEPDTSRGMVAQRLDAAAGLRWIGESFAIFRVAPVRQLLLNLAFLFAVTVVLSLPVIGFALVWLLIPALLVGPHAVARAASTGAMPPSAMLVSGFRGALGGQIRLGGYYLAGMALVLLATVPADGGRFAQAMMGFGRIAIEDLQSDEMQRAMLVGAGLQTVLLAALWYAPLLVAWRAVPAGKAVFFSAVAAVINWRAFLAYGIAMTLLFAVVLMLALAGAVLIGGSRALQANSALFAVVWTLLPVWFGSSYLSFRDVFDAGASVKSPTMDA